MNKIEEILQGKETYDPEYPTISISEAINAMKEFGKLCFDAGRKRDHLEDLQYIIFEDFLKEIENVKIN